MLEILAQVFGSVDTRTTKQCAHRALMSSERHTLERLSEGLAKMGGVGAVMCM